MPVPWHLIALVAGAVEESGHPCCSRLCQAARMPLQADSWSEGGWVKGTKVGIAGNARKRLMPSLRATGRLSRLHTEKRHIIRDF